VYAEKHNIPVHTVTKESIKEFNPANTVHPFDLVIAASFGLFIPRHILEERSTINVHPSLLPRYRGPAPIEHAILNNDRHTGISLQTISTEGFDKGIIFAQSLQIPIEETERLAALRYRLGKSASQMLLKSLQDRTYLAPKPVKTFTDESYAPFVHMQIDWTTMSAEHIVRVGRLFEPVTFLISKETGKLVSCHLSGISHRQQEGGKNKPGDFLMAREPQSGKKKLAVVCADGKTVFVEDIKVSGRNWISGLNFVTTSEERFWGSKFVPWRREFEDHDPKEFE
jgi:methionyl-tRNA formyltransferase